MTATQDEMIDAYLDAHGATLWGRAIDISSERGRTEARDAIRTLLNAFPPDPSTQEHLDLCHKALAIITTIEPRSATSRLDVTHWARALERCQDIAREAIEMSGGGIQ